MDHNYYLTYFRARPHPRPQNDFSINSSNVTPLQLVHQPCTRLSIIMKHCRMFCETTSLRGVPRIAKARDPKRRFLWLFFVLAFFLACIVCIVLLIIQYRQYDVIHQPKTMYNQSRRFPSLSICNLRPLSSQSIDALRQMGLYSITDYLNVLKSSMTRIKRSLSGIEKKLLTMSWNMNSYFLNLPNSTTPSDLGHDKLEMLVICFLVYKEGIFSSGISCDKAGRWISTLNSIFLNCQTFTVDDKYSNRTFTMEIVLFLDNPDEVYCHDCQEMNIASQLSGVRLNIHSAGTYPEILEKGINLMPGTLTEIRFIPREWSMMEPPHGKCNKKVDQRLDFNNVRFEYSEEACKKKILQEELIKHCGCIDFNQVPDHLLDYLSKKNVCKYFPFSPYNNGTLHIFSKQLVNEYLKRTRCEVEISSKINYKLTKCHSPCTFYTYDTTISSAEWPTKSYHTTFLLTLNKIIEKKLKSHPKVPNSTLSAWNTIKEQLAPYIELIKKIDRGIDVKRNKRMINSLNFVSSNFLAIQVNRPNFEIIRVEEKATVSLTNFLSQTGGIFSIWSGITFVCIVEILELIIVIFDDALSKKYDRDKDYLENINDGDNST